MTEKNELDYYDIVIDSIENVLNGWNVRYTKQYEAKKDAKSCVVGVVGNKNKGKSFLLEKLAGMDLPSGHSITTKGLSVKYPKDTRKREKEKKLKRRKKKRRMSISMR